MSDPVELDARRYAATLDGEPLRLTPREFELLAFLASHAGRLHTRREIYRRVWGGTPHEGAGAIVTEHVRRLRVKLGAHADLIVSVYGRGYRWDAPPRAADAPPDPDRDAVDVAAGLAEGVLAAARVLAGMRPVDREVALKRLRTDDAVRWMADGAP